MFYYVLYFSAKRESFGNVNEPQQNISNMCNHIQNTYNQGNLVSVFLGPNLGGKDYQAELLLKHGVPGTIISTGDLARKKRKSCPQFDTQYGHLMDQGDYLPNKVATGLVKEVIPTIGLNRGLIVLVGNPRNKIQAKTLDNIVSRPNQTIAFNLFINNPSVVIERAKKRHQKKGRTDDLDEAIVLKRYKLWLENEIAVCNKLKAKGVKIVRIDGTRSRLEIHKLIIQELRSHHEKIFEEWLVKQPPRTQRSSRIIPIFETAFTKAMKLKTLDED